MKTKLITLAACVLLAGCTPEPIEGKVVGKGRMLSSRFEDQRYVQFEVGQLTIAGQRFPTTVSERVYAKYNIGDYVKLPEPQPEAAQPEKGTP